MIKDEKQDFEHICVACNNVDVVYGEAGMSSDDAGALYTCIAPCSTPLRGHICVPGDKSISHRAVLFAAMAKGTSFLKGVLDSADVRSSIAAVSALGAQVHLKKQADGSLAGTISGWGSTGPLQPNGEIDCGNSGTTARLLMGILAPWDVCVTLTGDSSLQKRPMRRITRPLSEMGASFSPEGKETLPLTVCGTRDLRGITYSSPVASAQVKTAVLLAGVYARGVTTLHEPALSRNHTELMLPDFGVAVESATGACECADEGEVSTSVVSTCHSTSVTGPTCLASSNVVVPGDPSSAAFLACAALLCPQSCITVDNVSLNPARIGFVRVLERMGASITCKESSSQSKEPIGALTVNYTPHLRSCEILASQVASLIDEIPVLALVAAHAHGVSVFREVGELRVKETDRLAAIIDGLDLQGVHAWVEGDDLYVEGKGDLVDESIGASACAADRANAPVQTDALASEPVQAGTLASEPVQTGALASALDDGVLKFDSGGDHRLAMTWALVGLTGEKEVMVKDFDCVKISYPQFLDDIRKLTN